MAFLSLPQLSKNETVITKASFFIILKLKIHHGKAQLILRIDIGPELAVFEKASHREFRNVSLPKTWLIPDPFCDEEVRVASPAIVSVGGENKVFTIV